MVLHDGIQRWGMGRKNSSRRQTKRKMKHGHVSGVVFCSLVEKSLEKCQAI